MNDCFEKLKILLICDRPASDAGTILDHIDSFARYSRHEVFTLSTRGAWPKRLEPEAFDVLIIHYSMYIPGHVYLTRQAKKFIRDFKGLKVQFIQDEYRTVNAITGEMKSLGIDVLFTCYPEEEIEKVYSESRLPGVRKLNTLTGYVPEDLLDFPAPDIDKRSLDVTYRARKVPLYLGRLGAEKWQIVPRFLEAVRDSKLIMDLSTEERDRVYGYSWIRFLSSSKTVLGTESGASVVDFTGDIQKQVEAHLRANPSTSFEEIESRFLEPYEGRIRMNQISPRCFEAAALKTVMVLFEGEYSGILKPWRHFIPLKKDFSNAGEVVRAIKDPEKLQRIADQAFQEIASNPVYSFRNFISGFDTAVEEEFRKRKKTKSTISMTERYFNKRIQPLFTEVIFAKVRKSARELFVCAPRFIAKSVIDFLPRGMRTMLKRVLNSCMCFLAPSWKETVSTARTKSSQKKSKINTSSRLNILFFYRDDWHYPMRSTVKDHLEALRRYFPKHRYFFHNANFDLPKFLERRTFDAILLHNTFLCLRWMKPQKERWKKFRSQIAEMKGLKIAIPQDEYDHAHVLDEFLADAGVNIIFSNFDRGHRAVLYPKMHQKAEFRKALTGYLSRDFVNAANREFLPLKKRSIDVGYRATCLPDRFGSWGAMKSRIAPVFQTEARRLGLNTDISIEKKDEIYGRSWIRFLSSCKAVIGCEGGSSVLSTDGATRNSDQTEDGKFQFRALSPRHLECAATRTVQILVEGNYDGVLIPHRHYIPVKEDLSDVREALGKLNDPELCHKITETAYRELVQSGLFSDEAFARQLMLAIERHKSSSLCPAGSIGIFQSSQFLFFNMSVQLRKWLVAPVYSIGRALLRNKKILAVYQNNKMKKEIKQCAV